MRHASVVTAAPPLVCATPSAGERCATGAPHAPKREKIASILAKSCPKCSPNGRIWHPNEQQYRQHIAKWLQSCPETFFDEIRFHVGCFWSAKWEPKLAQKLYQNDGHVCITFLIALGPFGTSFLSGCWPICDVLEDIAVKSAKM